MADFLIESALLTHGLPSISNAEIIRSWHDGWQIAWLSDGRPVTGDAEEFCRFRDRAAGLRRINWFTYDDAKREGASGPLTASAVLKVCMETGARFAVSCGLGGLSAGEGPEKSNDIMALKDICVSRCSQEERGLEQGQGCTGLVATAFKDMFNAGYSIYVAMQEGINVFRLTDEWHEGYMFEAGSSPDPAEPQKSAMLQGYNSTVIHTEPGKAESLTAPGLYLVPVSRDRLITDRSVLEVAVSYGHAQERQGKAFHPAVNRMIDELTSGYSSQLQLASLIENIKTIESGNFAP